MILCEQLERNYVRKRPFAIHSIRLIEKDSYFCRTRFVADLTVVSGSVGDDPC